MVTRDITWGFYEPSEPLSSSFVCPAIFRCITQALRSDSRIRVKENCRFPSLFVQGNKNRRIIQGLLDMHLYRSIRCTIVNADPATVFRHLIHQCPTGVFDRVCVSEYELSRITVIKVEISKSS